MVTRVRVNEKVFGSTVVVVCVVISRFPWVFLLVGTLVHGLAKSVGVVPRKEWRGRDGELTPSGEMPAVKDGPR